LRRKKIKIQFANEEGEEVFSAREVFPKGNPAMLLRGYRGKLDMTHKELAEKLGVTQNRVSDMESGKRPISRDMAVSSWANYLTRRTSRFCSLSEHVTLEMLAGELSLACKHFVARTCEQILAEQYNFLLNCSGINSTSSAEQEAVFQRVMLINDKFVKSGDIS
jgi:plasmid maintenance system antidote protein VapI